MSCSIISDLLVMSVHCRLVLRCRQDARFRFAKMRSDVLVKLELLDNKHGTCHHTVLRCVMPCHSDHHAVSRYALSFRVFKNVVTNH